VELDPGAVALPHAGDLAVAEVGEQVRAREPGNPLPAIDVAARHRAPVARSVLVDGADRSRRCGALERVVALEARPPEVRPPPRPGREEVDLFPRALADVADPEVAGAAVERVAPRVAEAVGPDLGPGAGAADEGVVRRDRVRATARRPRVDAQHLSEQCAERLRVVVGVAGAPTVTHADPQHLVRSEHEVPAVVVRERVVEEEELAAGGGVGPVALHRVLDDAAVAATVGVLHVEARAVG